MASNTPSSELKEKLEQLFDSDVTIDKVLWELVPVYFQVKIPELKVISIGLKTEEDGKELTITAYVVNFIPVEKVRIILAVLDLINLSSSCNWIPYTYSFIDIMNIQGEDKLYNYTFNTKNLSGEIS